MLRKLTVYAYSVLFFVFVVTKLDVLVSLLVILPFFFVKLKHSTSLLCFLAILVGLGAAFSFLSPYDSFWIKFSFVFNFASIVCLFWERKWILSKFSDDIELFILVNFWLCFVLFVFVFFLHLILSVPIRGVWEVIGEITGRSVNYFVSYLLIALIYLLCEKKSILWIFCVCLAIYFSFLTESRAIIPFLLVAIVVCYLNILKKGILSFWLGTLVALTFFSVLLFNITDFVELFSNSRLAEKGVDSPRGLMVSEYVDILRKNFCYFIFGGDFELSKTIVDYGYNPHNSIIRLHSALGVFGLILLVIYLFVIFLHFDFFSLWLLSVIYILVRAPFDSVMLFTSVDIFLILTIMTVKFKSCQGRNLVRFTIGTK
ncbi:hypothetical protein ACS86_05705 [Vibrio alginolyticus]|nr:hypothetical protein ACS86_05705 [Vibrio alginolyticus]